MNVNVTISGIGRLHINVSTSINISNDLRLKDFLKILLEKVNDIKEYLDEKTLRPTPGMLILLNSIDINLLLKHNPRIKDIIAERNELKIHIIQVSHGG